MTVPPGPTTRSSCGPGCTERNSNLPSTPIFATSRMPAGGVNSAVNPPINGFDVETSPRTENSLRRSTGCAHIALTANALMPTRNKQLFMFFPPGRQGQAAMSRKMCRPCGGCSSWGDEESGFREPHHAVEHLLFRRETDRV